MNQTANRRSFIKLAGLGVGAGILGLQQTSCNTAKSTAKVPAIEGFDDLGVKKEISKIWVPVSDRKIRVGIVGYGSIGRQVARLLHPNVEVAAVSDLFPDRCAELAKVTNCKKTYPSLEELVKDDSLEAVFVATDAPSHFKHCIEVLKHGKHVACAVPAVYGSLEDAERLFEAVKQSGLKYMMYETSIYRENLYAMRQIYKAGGFGKVVYTEGEYWHYEELGKPGIGSYNNWRYGSPQQWYPTHSDAYYVGVTDGSFLEVSCLGIKSDREAYQPGKNVYNNPFATEISFYRTSEGGMARMGRSADTPGGGYTGQPNETGRLRGIRGSYYDKYVGVETNLPDVTRPALPPGMPAGGHGGSHGHLTEEFVRAILEDRDPLVNIAMSLNMTVGGIVAHQSALKDGEWMKIPQYKMWAKK